MPNNRSPEDLLKVLAQEDRPDEVERRSAERSVAEVEGEGAAAGFDVEMEKAEARAWRENMERDAAIEHPGRAPTSLSYIRSLRPTPRRSATPWVAAIAVAALLGGGFLSTLVWRRPPPVAAANPGELRKAAVDACKAARWQECLQRFEEAKAVDPVGDADGEVQAARARAVRELGAVPR
jgi:hypothetical protein